MKSSASTLDTEVKAYKRRKVIKKLPRRLETLSGQGQVQMYLDSLSLMMGLRSPFIRETAKGALPSDDSRAEVLQKD